MRTNKSALVTLNTLCRVPFRNGNSDTAFFKFGCAGRDVTVRIECRYRKFVAFLCCNRSDKRSEIFIVCDFKRSCALGCGCPAFRGFNFDKFFDCVVYASIVHVDDSIALFAVGELDFFFHITLCIFVRNDVCEFKESSLHNGVYTLCSAESGNDFKTVQRIELDVLFSNHILHRCRKFDVHFFRSPLRVEKERAAFFKV